MIEIDLSESAGAVRPWFKETVPGGPRLFSALNNDHPAIAMVDSGIIPIGVYCVQVDLGALSSAERLRPLFWVWPFNNFAKRAEFF